MNYLSRQTVLTWLVISAKAKMLLERHEIMCANRAVPMVGTRFTMDGRIARGLLRLDVIEKAGYSEITGQLTYKLTEFGKRVYNEGCRYEAHLFVANGGRKL